MPPVGIATQRASIGGTTLYNGQQIYYGDIIFFEATASTGYNAPTIYTGDDDEYLTVTSNVNMSEVISAGTLKSFTFTIPTIAGVSNQTITRTASPLKGAALEEVYNGAGGSSFTAYYNDEYSITTSTSEGYSATSTNTGKVTAAITSSSYITVTKGGTVSLTGFNAYYTEGGRIADTWTPPYSLTVTSAILTGSRNGSSYSVGYIIKKGDTVVKSGTGSSVTLTSTERNALNGRNDS